MNKKMLTLISCSSLIYNSGANTMECMNFSLDPTLQRFKDNGNTKPGFDNIGNFLLGQKCTRDFFKTENTKKIFIRVFRNSYRRTFKPISFFGEEEKEYELDLPIESEKYLYPSNFYINNILKDDDGIKNNNEFFKDLEKRLSNIKKMNENQRYLGFISNKDESGNLVICVYFAGKDYWDTFDATKWINKQKWENKSKNNDQNPKTCKITINYNSRCGNIKEGQRYIGDIQNEKTFVLENQYPGLLRTAYVLGDERAINNINKKRETNQYWEKNQNESTNSKFKDLEKQLKEKKKSEEDNGQEYVGFDLKKAGNQTTIALYFKEKTKKINIIIKENNISKKIISKDIKIKDNKDLNENKIESYFNTNQKITIEQFLINFQNGKYDNEIKQFVKNIFESNKYKREMSCKVYENDQEITLTIDIEVPKFSFRFNNPVYMIGGSHNGLIASKKFEKDFKEFYKNDKKDPLELEQFVKKNIKIQEKEYEVNLKPYKNSQKKNNI